LALLTSSSLHLAAKESDASTNSSSSLFKRHQRPSFERFLLYATISNPMTTEEDARMMPKRHLEQLEPSGTSKKTNDSKNSSPAAEEEYNRTSNGKSKNRMRQLRRYYRKRLQQDATNEKEGKGGKWDPSLATAATSESPTKKKQPAEELKTVWQMYNRCTEGFLQVASSSDGGGGETTAVSARGRLPGYECRSK
jgi:hypothetical protein